MVLNWRVGGGWETTLIVSTLALYLLCANRVLYHANLNLLAVYTYLCVEQTGVGGGAGVLSVVVNGPLIEPGALNESCVVDGAQCYCNEVLPDCVEAWHLFCPVRIARHLALEGEIQSSFCEFFIPCLYKQWHISFLALNQLEMVRCK